MTLDISSASNCSKSIDLAVTFRSTLFHSTCAEWHHSPFSLTPPRKLPSDLLPSRLPPKTDTLPISPPPHFASITDDRDTPLESYTPMPGFFRPGNPFTRHPSRSARPRISPPTRIDPSRHSPPTCRIRTLTTTTCSPPSATSPMSRVCFP